MRGTGHSDTSMTSPAVRAAGVRRRVLVVAYYFPPLGLSGVQRVAKWCKYLPSAGWDVTVLTVEPSAYFAFDETLLQEVECAGVDIVRTRPMDPTRRGERKNVPFPSERRRKLFTWLTGLFFLPDNKRGWKGAALEAWNDIQQPGSFDLVFSSAPPYTGFLVGSALAQKAGVPHVMDYRDDWMDNPRHRYPTVWHRRRHGKLETRVLEQASFVTTINSVIADRIKSRSPGVEVRVVPQGFDPEDMSPTDGIPLEMTAERALESESPRRPVRFLYAGMFYDAQQPDTFLNALSALKKRIPDLAGRLEARFVGLFPDEKVSLIAALGLEDVVHLTGYQSHVDTIRELMSADVLWMTIGHQEGEEMISTGKLFEYMGTKKPILALIPEGAAKEALKGYQACWTCNPEDVDSVSDTIASFLDLARTDTLPKGEDEWILPLDRSRQAHLLAGWFDELLDS